MTRSDACYDKCIKKGKTFCANSSFSSGICYEANETPRNQNICSNTVGTHPFNSLRVMTCPNEAHCYGGDYEKKVFSLPSNGQKIGMTELSNDIASDDFIRYDICSYIVSGPSRGSDGDFLHFKLWELTNARAYIHDGT